MRAITIVIALAARTAAADCEALRAQLAADAEQAERWNLGWGLTFTGATILQSAIAISPISDRVRDAMWVGAAKSGIGALSHAILPLRIEAPRTCADAERIHDKAVHDERGLFWLGQIGGFALNAAGALLLVKELTWRDGLVSFAVGFPVGVLHGYTLPRRSWRITPTPGGAMLSGTF